MMRSLLVLAALCLAVAPATARDLRTVPAPRAPLAPISPAADPCLQCGFLYSIDFGGQLFEIDPATGAATVLGIVPFPQFFDLAISSDGVLYGAEVDGGIHRIDACTFTTVSVDPNTVVSLGGHPTQQLLYGATPPLLVYDITADSSMFVPANIGPDPPDWCGFSSGDIAYNTEDDLLYATLVCDECAAAGLGDMLVTIDPTTAAVVSEIGCLSEAGTGAPLSAVFGLAFDDECRLIASQGFGPNLYIVDLATAQGTPLPVTGVLFEQSTGLASMHCPGFTCGGAPEPEPASCRLRMQGFWKRQCRGPHPAGEFERLQGYAPCVAARTQTFRDILTAEQICEVLNPDPQNDKCLKADAEFMSLLLSVCSGSLSESCCVSTPATGVTTVGEAIDAIDALLSNPARTVRDCILAEASVGELNTAHPCGSHGVGGGVGQAPVGDRPGQRRGWGGSDQPPGQR